VTHFIRRRTASFVRRLGSSHIQTTSSRTTGAANVFRRSRLCSRYAQLEDSDFCRGVADAGDLRLSWRLTPSWNCCRRRRSCTLTQRSKWSRRFIIGRLLFVPFVGFAFPVCYALMSRKTTELYVKVFQEIQQLVPQFAPTCAVADFEEASVAGFQHVYSDAGVAGCWFHYMQAIIKIVHLWCRVARSRDVLRLWWSNVVQYS